MDRLKVVRRAILAKRSIASSATWTALAVVVPTALRWVVDRGESGMPFVTYYPAVLIVSVLLGWRYGAVAAFVSAVVANRLLREDPVLFYGSATDALVVLLFLVSCAVIVLAGATLRRLVHEQEQARVREDELKSELLHRVKNMFAIVRSLSVLTARNSQPEEFPDRLESRLSALENANHMLGSSDHDERSIQELVDSAVGPFRDNDNIAARGPSFSLSRASIVPLALAFHELCTNALKYGSLSVPSGRVLVEWELCGEDGEDLLIRWIESGGPPVSRSSHLGLGSLLLRPRYPLNQVSLAFEPEGVECTIRVAGGA